MLDAQKQEALAKNEDEVKEAKAAAAKAAEKLAAAGKQRAKVLEEKQEIEKNIRQTKAAIARAEKQEKEAHARV